MFDRDSFIAYVGDKSGSSYASGLKSIEGLYAVGIDEAYETDMCASLLSKIEQDKKRTDLTKNELHKRRDYASHLKKYIDYRFNTQVSTQRHEADKPTISDKQYWPASEEYNPNITIGQWQQVLNDPTVTSPQTLSMLKMMLELGEESTCANLAETYGNVHNHYNLLGSTFGEKVQKALGCPTSMDDGRVFYYPIPFVGRYITENNLKRYSWKLRDELREALMDMDLSAVQTFSNKQPATDIGKNTILYGPPGTGKTYHAVIYAVAIIENKQLGTVEQEDYADVLERYNTYKAQGRIEFTTFHQSYGYEEFIEGIRPAVDQKDAPGEIRYDVMPGVFKDFCEQALLAAAGKNEDWGIRDNPVIWKVSLQGTGPNPIREDCLKNSHIRIDWTGYGDRLNEEKDFADGGKNVLNAFVNGMQIGDIVLSCFSENEIDAVGVITDDYEWVNSYPDYKRLRKVDWLVKNICENIRDINGGKKMTLSTVYRLNQVTLPDVLNIVKKYRPQQAADKGNRVFIIDEINRGNISKIFGELIALVEPSKRIGQPEGMTVKLPYSQKPFGVPENIYLIGTMNTADRSIATIDTALRRRFCFQEMQPNPAVLDGVIVEGISIRDLLVHINERISVLYDREHTIGHAYFMPLKNDPTIETLSSIFENSIIPLLQEYYYEDYEKIGLVLGDNQKADQNDRFILKKDNDYAELFGTVDLELDESCSYEINRDAFGRIAAYSSI